MQSEPKMKGAGSATSTMEKAGILIGSIIASLVLASATLSLASSRTDGIPALQMLVVFAGVPAFALYVIGLAMFRGIRFKDFVWSLAVLAAVFVLAAFCQVRYAKGKKLSVNGIEVLIERNYGDPFDNFYARWKTKGGNWSEREQIGWSLDHKPPFSARFVEEGMVEIIDGTRQMSSIVGPRARHAPYGSRWREQR